MTEKMILSGFDYAKDVYAEKGIDVEKAMEKTFPRQRPCTVILPDTE